MNEALNLIHDALDVFSGKTKSLKVKEPGLVDLMDAARNREKARGVKCWNDCRLPAWVGGCPYLNVNGKACQYYGPNTESEESLDS
jgi:hypothetical protein